MNRFADEPFGLLSLTSDFGVQSQGVGAMEAVVYEIAPRVRVIHLMHGLPAHEIIAAARTLETLETWPQGYHVCVCDPGVGTSRRALALQVHRGDYLIGPDNGVLIPATRFLGGIKQVVSIENPAYMRPDVSPLFHGRDVFAPAAAHLANGVPLSEFGPLLDPKQLNEAPYEEASITTSTIAARVIQINRFGSIHLNIRRQPWDNCGFEHGQTVHLKLHDTVPVSVTYGHTFGSVAEGEGVILRDDYGRVEVAINMGRFIDQHPIGIGDSVRIQLPQ